MSVSAVEWSVRAAWTAQARWTVADGAQRLARSLRLLHSTFADGTAVFTTDPRADSGVAVDDPDLAARLEPVLRASRNQRLFGADERLGDAAVLLFAAARTGVHVRLQQVATGAGWHPSQFRIGFDEAQGELLARHADRIPSLVAGLGEVWQAENAWLDFVHVRQDWNQWTDGCPVFGWATWVSRQHATVDTTGLDLDVTDSGDGVLIVLRTDPVRMADPDGNAGRDVIGELARRTVLADGRRLLDVNHRLRDALAADG